MSVEEGEEIVEIARASGKICAVNWLWLFSRPSYEAMVARGDLGAIRLISEFAHSHHADAADADNPHVRWRYDPHKPVYQHNLLIVAFMHCTWPAL